ncbi:hypothetical protein B0H10DRAFT_2167291 [Mycena sp. CBHHK59/15]|nr:hypothetical protein B0H10DRAFT_2167291 [Mycena sp. CBHHK59/15]
MPDVPLFSALQKKQAQLTKYVNIQTTRHVSAMGNEFYMNHPAELLALDWANPLVWEFIQVYLEITNHISEFNHANKWTKEIDLDDLSPMWVNRKKANHKHFYIKELAQLKNSEFAILMPWVIFNKEEYAKVHKVIHYPEDMVRVRATDLKYNYLDLRETRYSLKSPEHAKSSAQKAKGRPVFSVRIIPWSDDVSGNVSKQYNPHMNVYMANANLLHRKVLQEYFVRFCSTSPHASSGEQFEALAEDLEPSKYHEAYDCELEQEILFRIFAHALPADNPQQAESASNAGVHTNLWSAHRKTDEGYRALFKPGIPRTPAETIGTIKHQIWAACAGVQEVVDDLQTSTGVKDKTALFWIEKLIIKARETQIKDFIQWELYNWVILQPEDRVFKLPKDSGKHTLKLRQNSLMHWNTVEHHRLCPGDHFNILLRVRGLDLHKDSPCEILHLILLGDDKYIWHETNSPWDKSKGDKFAVRLQSSSTNGLNLSSQLRAFHLHDDLFSKNLFDLWKALGGLGALLWFPEIRNRNQYLADVQVCIDNVLDIWALVDPARIMTKYKMHVLPHLPDDIRRFGPAILFATEGFECWNSIFRLCSILSNHQAPSHDIGVTLADMEHFKHQAGPEVKAFLEKNKELQWQLGWMDKLKPKAGSIKLAARRTAVSAPWCNILGTLWTAELDARGAGKVWMMCKYVVSQAGDICMKDSFVFFKCKRICNILIPITASTTHDQAVVVVRKFVVSTTRDLRLNIPVLSPLPKIYLAKPENILFFFNAQHDCYGLKCPAVTGTENVVQERNLTGRTQTAINTDIYIVNMHALHNAHLLRETLMRSLTAPIPYLLDHEAKHEELAALLRVSGPAKRAAAAKKSKETREKKKQAKTTAAKGAREAEEEESEGPDDMDEMDAIEE